MNFQIEYYTPPASAVEHVTVENVKSEAEAEELFTEKVPLGIIRKIRECDEDGKVIEPPTMDDV